MTLVRCVNTYIKFRATLTTRFLLPTTLTAVKAARNTTFPPALPWKPIIPSQAIWTTSATLYPSQITVLASNLGNFSYLIYNFITRINHTWNIFHTYYCLFMLFVNTTATLLLTNVTPITSTPWYNSQSATCTDHV